MARYKHYDYDQMVMLAVNLEQQIVPGTFEYAVHTLIEQKLDLSAFDACYKNDDTGAPAYDPAILLKIILCAYSQGVTSSRRMSELCCQNVIFMALAAHSAPHFSTLADFIALDGVFERPHHSELDGGRPPEKKCGNSNSKSRLVFGVILAGSGRCSSSSGTSTLAYQAS